MTRASAVAFNLLFYAWTTVLSLVALPLLLFPQRFVLDFARFWIRTTFALLHRTVGLSHQVRGQVPERAVIVASKHQSAWDTLAFLLLLRRPVYVLKHELVFIPIWGWLVRHGGMIPVDRSGGAAALRRMIAAAKAMATTGRPIVIFPEGTRSAPGASRPYNPGIAALYHELALPVVPVALNSGLFWPRRRGQRPGVITVEFLQPIPPGLPRREFMKTLEEQIEGASHALLAEVDAAA